MKASFVLLLPILALTLSLAYRAFPEAIPPTNPASSSISTEITQSGRYENSGRFGLSKSVRPLDASNSLPVLQSLTNLIIIFPNRSSAAISFTVGDLETAADSLSVTGKAYNATLLPAAGFQFSGSGSNRVLVLTPAPEQRGKTTITLTVTDAQGGQASKSATVRVEDFTPIWGALSGSGIGVPADLDRDGYLDIVRMDRWLQNTGGTNVVLATPSINAFGPPVLTDVDNDGDIDLIATGGKLTRIWTNGPWAHGPVSYQDCGVTNLVGYNSGWAILWADFAQDGRYDLIMAGETNYSISDATRTYLNKGGLNFELMTNLLPDVGNAALACADFNRDGTIDVCVAGLTQSGPYTAILTNDGTGHFAEMPAGLPATTSALLLVGDFDNDGWPDLLVSGSAKLGNLRTNISKIFRNNHDGTFSDYASFAPFLLPFGAVTDLDSDGRLDVVLCGDAPDQPEMYLNEGGGQFVDIGPALVSALLTPTSIAAGDLTQDGRPDLIMPQYVLRNNFPDTNTAPDTPTGLAAVPGQESVTLSWPTATDFNQPGGLSYNLRVGTAPGGIDVLSPLADITTGRRWVIGPGNASESLQWRLRLKPGVYFWSVQAIDHAGAGSAFAPEQSFVIAVPRPRILSVSVIQGTVFLQAQFSSAGSYSILTSPDLNQWTALPPSDYSAGTTNILVTGTTDSCRYFRLRSIP